MMALADGAIVVIRERRAIPVASVGSYEQYKALVAYDVRPAIAAAVAARLVTIKLTA